MSTTDAEFLTERDRVMSDRLMAVLGLVIVLMALACACGARAFPDLPRL